MITLANILLAEDDTADYDFFVDAFSNVCPDAQVTRAINGLNCISILKTSRHFDIIFLDLNMPGYNGIDCLKHIKSNASLAEIPVIIYSTSHYIKNIDTCYKQGAHYYIVKPVHVGQLINNLKHVLDQLSNNFDPPDKQRFVVGVSATVEDQGS
jgi:CheY-like chemotaxis protein